MDLAVRTGRLPAEIDAMPYLDSIKLHEAHAAARKAEAQFAAALHGRTLQP